MLGPDDQRRIAIHSDGMDSVALFAAAAYHVVITRQEPHLVPLAAV